MKFNKIQKPADVVHAMEKAEQGVAVLVFNVILFSLFWQAVSRKIGMPSTWTDESSRLLFVWMGALGCHLAQKENIHVRIDAILLALPKKVQLVIEALNNVIMIGLLYGLTFYVYIMISKHNNEIIRLTYEIASLKKELEEIKKNEK